MVIEAAVIVGIFSARSLVRAVVRMVKMTRLEWKCYRAETRAGASGP